MSPTAKIKVGFGIGVAILVSSGIAALFETFRWEDTVRKVTHSHEIIEKLDELALNAQYPGNFALAQQDEAALESLAADTPSQKENLLALQRLFGNPATLSGPNLRDAISRMETEQHRLLALQTVLRDRQQALSYDAFILRGVLSIALILGAAWQILIDRERRMAAERTLAVREAQYRQVVELAGDPALRGTMGVRSRIRAEALWDGREVARSTLDVYRRLTVEPSTV